jgi:hypothetical protein
LVCWLNARMNTCIMQWRAIQAEGRLLADRVFENEMLRRILLSWHKRQKIIGDGEKCACTFNLLLLDWFKLGAVTLTLHETPFGKTYFDWRISRWDRFRWRKCKILLRWNLNTRVVDKSEITDDKSNSEHSWWPFSRTVPQENYKRELRERYQSAPLKESTLGRLWLLYHGRRY